jgi:hypothetical protein
MKNTYNRQRKPGEIIKDFYMSETGIGLTCG